MLSRLMAFATALVRCRKNRSGTSGAFDVASTADERAEERDAADQWEQDVP